MMTIPHLFPWITKFDDVVSRMFRSRIHRQSSPVIAVVDERRQNIQGCSMRCAGYLVVQPYLIGKRLYPTAE